MGENNKAFEEKLPRVKARINDCTSIEEYKKLVDSMREEKLNFDKESPRGKARISDCTSVEEYKKLVDIMRKEGKLKVTGFQNDRERTNGVSLCDNSNDPIASAIKNEPQDSCDQTRYYDGIIHDKNLNQAACHKMELTIETDGDIQRITKDIISSIGGNSANFKMKIKIGQFKFEVSNDT